MSDSENEVDYEEILRTYSYKNTAIEVYGAEIIILKEKYEEAFKQYKSVCNEYYEEKEKYQLLMKNTLEGYNILGILHQQCEHQMKILQKQDEEINNLKITSKFLEENFDSEIENLNKEVLKISSMDENLLKKQLEDNKTSLDAIKMQIEQANVSLNYINTKLMEEEGKFSDIANLNKFSSELSNMTKGFKENEKKVFVLNCEVGSLRAEIEKQKNIQNSYNNLRM